MKIPAWLPDAKRPLRPEGGVPAPMIARLTDPFSRFLHVEAAGGVVLLACTILALAMANSPWSAAVASFWHMPLGFNVGATGIHMSLLDWINDGLMTIFFFVVGLEIKRELVHGELHNPRNAVLPAAAALGGMVAPAAIYLSLEHGKPGADGWAIPMATDIAFVVGFLALLGKRVPFSLKVLLLTLAIIDDLGAVLVIAVAFTEKISVPMLGLAAGGFGITLICRWLGVRTIAIYVVIGAGIWLAVLESGVHSTVAGVLIGLLTPSRPWLAERSLLQVLGETSKRLGQDEDDEHAMEHHAEAVRLLDDTVRETISPLDRLETALHPWVAFAIMPVFALANAGVHLNLPALADPVAIAVAVGLVLGKPLGIVVFSAVAVKLGLAKLPDGVGWKVMTGAGCLAGIGFTMSLFIGGLALDGSLLEAGKIGTLAGSAVSAVLGCTLLWCFLKDAEKAKTDGALPTT
jgi:NhaA family Na+:H+ antiporter